MSVSGSSRSGSDADEGSTFATHGPAGDGVAGDGSQVEELFEVVGDFGVLTEEDFNVAEVEEVLGDLLGLRTGVAGAEVVGGFVGVGDLDVAVGTGQAQVGIEGGHRAGPEAQLSPDFVADVDASPAAGLTHAASPRVETHQGHADGVVAERFQS